MQFFARPYKGRPHFLASLMTDRKHPGVRFAIAALGLFVVGSAMAQVSVAPPFRTAPRSLITERVDRTRTLPVRGALNADLRGIQDVGETDAATPLKNIQLLLRRPEERQAAFDANAEALHTAGTASFHRWLTPSVVGAEFGPSASDLATIRGYLESEGFTVNEVGTSGMYIDFTGTVAQVEHSFKTKIHNFRDPNGPDTMFSAIAEASLPAALAPAVVGFVSLNNIRNPRPMMRRFAERPKLPTGVSADATPGLYARPNDTEANAEYYVGPQDFYTIYNENPLLSAGTTGSGVTIAVLEDTQVVAGDVTVFRNKYSVSPSTPNSLTYYNGNGSTCVAPGINGDETEANLDIEWAGAVAPGANLVMMSCKKETTFGFLYAAEQVIESSTFAAQIDIISMSYGIYEGYTGDKATPTDTALVAELWEQAASQGQTVVVSAGDTGNATQDGNYGDHYADDGLTVSAISSTAWNVSAGGTDFLDAYNDDQQDSAYGIAGYWNTAVSKSANGYSSAKSYIPETTWNDSCASSIYANVFVDGPLTPTSFCGDYAYTRRNSPWLFAAGGGGTSSVNARPSWQAGGAVYGLAQASTANFRLQPDVSLFASNGWWGHALDFYSSDNGGTLQAGGTSFVAPQLAGIFALIKGSTGERLGQPNYVLYAMAGSTLGTSTYAGSGCNGSGTTTILGTTSTTPGADCIFYDVLSGDTNLPCINGSNDCYTQGGQLYEAGILSTNSAASGDAYANAAQGWDFATGIGSINIGNLVANWQSPTNSALFTPVVAVSPLTTTYTYGAPPSLTYTAIVSGPGSLPTGAVTFSGTPSIGAIGSANVLVPQPACASSGVIGTTAGNCYESATQAYRPSASTVSAGVYTITAAYSTTNENYKAGSGTATITVSKQTPTLTVANDSTPTGTNAALIASLAYTGVGFPPIGGVDFTVNGGAAAHGACTGTATPLSCTVSYPIGALNAGTYTISASYPGDVNYNAAGPVTATLTVTVTTTNMTFTVSTPQHTMFPSIVLAAVSNSPATIVYSVLSGPATISGSTATVTGAGSVTLQAAQSTTPGYTASSAMTTFTVLAGSVWVGDGSNAVSTFDLLGNAIAGSGTGFSGAGIATIASPLGEAFDAKGYLWVASAAGVSRFTFPNPAAVGATPVTTGGIHHPVALAIDGNGEVWVANNNGTLSALSNAGAALSPSTGYTCSGVTTAAGGIAIDLSGNVWVTNSADNSVTEVLGAAVPAAPLSSSLANGTTGAQP